MKAFSKIIFALFVLIAVFSAFFVVGAETYQGLTYVVLDTEVVITGIDGATDSVEIPSKINGYPVTGIASKAFFDSIGLESITIPETIKYIDGDAFNFCTDLQKVNITDLQAWCEIIFGSATANPLKYAKNLYIDGVLATDITIPDGTLCIGEWAFYGCQSIKSVAIADSVTRIGWDAFYNCTNLETINIPEGVQSINAFTFYNCNSLESISIPDTVTNIGMCAFSGCESLLSIIIPEGETTISPSAFYGCVSLETIIMSESITNIGIYAFDGCTAISEIYYTGTEQQWNSITVQAQNESFAGATVYYNCKHSVTFDANGGYGAPENQLKKYRQNLKISKITPTKPGYTFLGWSTSPIGEVEYYPGSVYTAEAPLELYAVWYAQLKFDFESLRVSIGKTANLMATRIPEDINDTISWYSHDESIATVSEKGVVKAVGSGTTTIHAVAESGLEAICEVTVFAPIKTIKMTRSSASMVVGGADLQLSVTATPVDHTDRVIWSSADETIATVDENGVVTAHKTGKVKITAASGSGKKATCTITVGVPADAVEFSALKSTSLAVGKTLTLKAKAFRLDGEKPVSTNVRYEIVDDEGIVTLDAKGKLKALETGIVTVRAYPEACLDDDIYDEVTINVCIPATKVVLNYKSAAMVVGGNTLDLDATLSPENHTDTLTFTSANEEIATVDHDGVVTAHSTGKVKITATTGSGKKATCTVTVGVPADTVEFSSLKATSLAVGKTLTLKAKASRADKAKPVSTDVVYEIVDGQEYATIDAKGKLKAIAFGEVTIRATAQASLNGAYDEVTIRVCVPATKVVLNYKSATVALGDELYLEATLSPETQDDTLTWSSSNDEIATVDEFGVVTVHAKGSVKITAKTGSGKKATCSDKVVE